MLCMKNERRQRCTFNNMETLIRKVLCKIKCIREVQKNNIFILWADSWKWPSELLCLFCQSKEFSSINWKFLL